MNVHEECRVCRKLRSELEAIRSRPPLSFSLSWVLKPGETAARDARPIRVAAWQHHKDHGHDALRGLHLSVEEMALGANVFIADTVLDFIELLWRRRYLLLTAAVLFGVVDAFSPLSTK